MSGHQRSLLIDDHPLQVLPDLARAIGLNGAIMLQQVHYWLNRSDNVQDGRRFVYKTFAEWREEFPFWSEKTIKRVIAELRGKGLVIQSKRDSTSWDRTNWYSIDYSALNSLNFSIGTNCPDASGQSDLMHKDNLTQCIGSTCPDRSGQSDPMRYIGTETTTKTTSPGAFDKFWTAYPRKTAKQVARKAFLRLKVDDALLVTMLKAIESHTATDQWQRGIIPHASTWLNQRRWEDEFTVKTERPVDKSCIEQIAPGQICGMPGEGDPATGGRTFICAHHLAKRRERQATQGGMPPEVQALFKNMHKRNAAA